MTIIGPEGVILGFGDPDNMGSDPTTFTTVGHGQFEFMWVFDDGRRFVSYNPSEITSIKGIIPIVSLNGEDQGAWSLDDDYWTIGDGRSDTGLTLVVWISRQRFLSAQVFGKYSIDDRNPQREWLLQYQSEDEISVVLRDESTNAVLKLWQTANPEVNVWRMIAFRYSPGSDPFDGMAFGLMEMLE